MALTLATAHELDALRIADIHMAAFHSNGMLLAQFPTPAVREELWMSLVDKAIKEIRDPQWEVLVVKDENHNIVSFAKWCLPIPESAMYEEEPWEWPEGTDMAILNEWTNKVDSAAGRMLGRTPCYRLSFIATDPQYAGRGAGSLLVNWGLDRSRKEKVPVALESTMDAVPFYRKWKFEAEAHISMPLKAIEDGTVLYEEECLVYRPRA